MARKFLYLIALLVVMVIAGLFALNIWSQELTRFAFVPKGQFAEQVALESNAYEYPDMWFSRPGIGASDPSRWQPPKASETRSLPPNPAEPAPIEPALTPPPSFAVFFVHPTSFLDRSQWNAPLDDPESQKRARTLLQGMASPFSAASEIWAPRYRQATFGAYLTDAPEAQQALDAAYRDVEQAFQFFVSSIGKDVPIVIAGHSQGSHHITRLLHDHIAATPLTSRIAAVYAAGWPVSVKHDLPGMGLPACAAADQTGCIISWSSFAEPADPEMVMEHYAQSTGFDGQPRADSTIACVNPLTGALGGEAGAERNLGTLVPDKKLKSAALVPQMVPARCDERGLLLIGPPPEMGAYVLPGNNYHIYDIPLFWENLRQDVNNRVRAWTKRP